MTNRPSALVADIERLIADLQKIEEVSKSLNVDAIAKPCSLHDEHGSLLWANQGLIELIGYDPAAGASGLLECMHVQDRVAIAHFLADDRSETEQAERTAEFRTVSTSQRKPKAGWIEISAASVHGSESNTRFIISTYRNITAAKEHAETAEMLRIESDKANNAKSQFLANISHELRTPLNAILGFSELLNSPVVNEIQPEKRSEYIGLIHDSASHLLALLNGILDMSKIENGMYEIFPESFCFSRCLENTTAIMEGQAAKTAIRLETFGYADMPDIVADERAVKQILINLLSNAIKFSHENGTVTVNARRRARTVTIEISDEGVGISRGHLENLGEPFFQADSKYDRKFEGTGLGLSVVKGLVELHGGEVRFASERGKGTTVTVTLPIHGRTGRQVPAHSTVEKITAIGPKTDDAPGDLRITRNTA